MKTRAGRPRGLTRLARALGLDRNPLRRATDRAEAWIRVGLLAVFLIAGPMAALGAGHWACHAGTTAARVPAAPIHRVEPTALHGISTTTDLPRVGQGGRARARWEGAGPSARTGGGDGRDDDAGRYGADAAGRPPARSRAPEQAAPNRLGDGLVQSRTAVVQAQPLTSSTRLKSGNSSRGSRHAVGSRFTGRVVASPSRPRGRALPPFRARSCICPLDCRRHIRLHHDPEGGNGVSSLRPEGW
jgi:hypothetical protein